MDNSSDTVTNKFEKEKEEFLSYFQTSNVPNPDKWPDESPIYLAASQRAPNIKYDLPLQESCASPPFPLDGTAVPLDGPLFKGVMVSRIKNAPRMTRSCSSNPTSNGNYFKGKSRMFQWTVQGIFKKRIRFDKLITGQEFDRPFCNTPSTTLMKKGLHLLKSRLPDTFECDLLGRKPRFEHPLICGCQGFRVDDPNDANMRPPPRQLIGEGEDGEIIEDTRILDNVPQSSLGRRKYFSSSDNLERFYFETNYMYTFEFYSNFFSPMRHRIEIAPFFSFHMIKYFNGYPLFFSMGKDKDSGEYLFATEIWHKGLLDYDTKPLTKKKFSFKRRSIESKLDEGVD